ncbi:leucyl aminopeptidase [Luteipulveratus sp. YIM 133132]|uniref:Probable cytosol aminopeptidase n=1 Tax=Luteipulveratus flavus TaxID=3031728 RepID=A0ABT6C5R7_9MICO|nr:MULTISPECIES: leucyl aminopeptidase [unclassified Luteipulveratus]MDE9366437.1 leucyl aminopeptidase [Luteipulveratus sp. YIM 133132]MDF8264288.1 leucyl aminopeptidase [Luteipulveratus sp. YIM 133296]
MTTLTLTDQKTGEVKADVLVLLSVTLDDGVRLASTDGLSSESVDHIGATLTAIGAKGGADEAIKLTGVPGVTAPIVVVAGTGLDHEPTATDHESVRRAVGSAVRGLADTGHAAVAAPGSDAELAGAAAEGALFGAYAFTAYRKKGGAKAPVERLTVLSGQAGETAVKDAVHRAEVVADSQAWARDLVNTPPNDLYPESFADATRQRLQGTKVKVDVMDEKALAKAGCGGLIGVGRGSSRLPRLVTLTYKPAKATRHIAVVGKGITFDSGGLCIKPATGMVTMKCDMAGAAAAAAAVDAVARLGLPVAMTVYLCLAENMTGSDAQRPGDVVTMRNGKSVEIINTDAEGRLVMADGLSYASEQQPDLVIDIATLTGAAVMAFGGQVAAVLGNDDTTRDQVIATAGRVGEDAWAMPLREELRKHMDSDVADVKHTGQKEGGAITAALFLREFVGDGKNGKPLPWVHIDIAGPAFNESSAHGYTPKGATGFGVRTLVGLAQDHA